MAAADTSATTEPAARMQRSGGPRFLSLAATLAVAEFKLRYAGSALSYLWSFCKPLLLFGVLWFVFVHALKFGAGSDHFAVALLLSIVLWTFFAEITNVSVTLLVSHADMLRKLSFPRIVLPISISFSALVTLCLNLLVVMVFMVSSGVEPTWSWLIMPLLVVELYVLALGLGLLLSSLFVRFRDVGQLWEVMLQALFYATPIIYPLSVVDSVRLRKILLLSPPSQIIQEARHVMVDTGSIYSSSVFDLLTGVWWLVPLGGTVVIFALGLTVYQRIAPGLTEQL